MPAATIFDASTEAGDILATVAPGPADPLTIWAVGAWACWHAQGLARIWDSGHVLEGDNRGGTLSYGEHHRTIQATGTHVTLTERGEIVTTVRLTDVAKLAAIKHMPPGMAPAVRQILTQRRHLTEEASAAWNLAQSSGVHEPDEQMETRERARAAVERECQRLASEAWQHIRPADALFDLAPAGSGR